MAKLNSIMAPLIRPNLLWFSSSNILAFMTYLTISKAFVLACDLNISLIVRGGLKSIFEDKCLASHLYSFFPTDTSRSIHKQLKLELQNKGRQ